VLGGLFIGLWPALAEEPARQKFTKALERRFDDVAVEGFYLQRNSLHIEGFGYLKTRLVLTALLISHSG